MLPLFREAGVKLEDVEATAEYYPPPVVGLYPPVVEAVVELVFEINSILAQTVFQFVEGLAQFILVVGVDGGHERDFYPLFLRFEDFAEAHKVEYLVLHPDVRVVEVDFSRIFYIGREEFLEGYPLLPLFYVDGRLYRSSFRET